MSQAQETGSRRGSNLTIARYGRRIATRRPILSRRCVGHRWSGNRVGPRPGQRFRRRRNGLTRQGQEPEHVPPVPQERSGVGGAAPAPRSRQNRWCCCPESTNWGQPARAKGSSGMPEARPPAPGREPAPRAHWDRPSLQRRGGNAIPAPPRPAENENEAVAAERAPRFPGPDDRSTVDWVAAFLVVQNASLTPWTTPDVRLTGARQLLYGRWRPTFCLRSITQYPPQRPTRKSLFLNTHPSKHPAGNPQRSVRDAGECLTS